MLHRTRREGLEGKFCSTDVVQPTRTCTMKNYVLPALGLLALAPTTALAKDEPVKRFAHAGATYRYTVTKVGDRSEERRVGKESVGTGGSRGVRDNTKNNMRKH